MYSTSSESETSRPVDFRAFQNQDNSLMQYYYQDPLGELYSPTQSVNPMHMQGTSGFNPQYYPNIPTNFGQVPLNSYSPLLPNPPFKNTDWQNMQVIDETNYYKSPRPATPDTQYYTPPSQGAPTTCESEAEQEKMDHRRKIRRRKQRKSRVQPSQLNGSIPNDPRQYDSRPLSKNPAYQIPISMPDYHLPYPLQPTMPMVAPLPTQVPTLPQQFHPWPRQETRYHQEPMLAPLPTQEPTLPQQFHPWPRQETRHHQERPNNENFNPKHLSQSVAMIHLLYCCATMLLCFSILLPLYCAALLQ